MSILPLESYTKIDIVNRLACLNNWHNYLEICTPTTGGRYVDVDRSQITTCHRLMYRCADDFSDGMQIDFRSTSLDISSCLNQIKNNRLLYDVILVDPWHEYKTSYRDLEESLLLLKEDGALVVHDCFPQTEALAQPLYNPGGWCGVTYKAFIDFVTANSQLYYYTVNTDYGCGIIQYQQRKNILINCLGQFFSPARKKRPRLIEEWKKLDNDFPATFRFLQDHANELLHLKSVTEFLKKSHL